MQFSALKELFDLAELDLTLSSCTSGAKVTSVKAFERNDFVGQSNVRYPKNTGVYLLIKFINKWGVLFRGDEPIYEVVYIGTTNKFYNRMQYHRRLKSYDYCVLLLLDKPFAYEVEKVLIIQIDPPLNVVHTQKDELQ